MVYMTDGSPGLLGFGDFDEAIGAVPQGAIAQKVIPKPRPGAQQAAAARPAPRGAAARGAMTRVFPKGTPKAKPSPHKNSLKNAAKVAIDSKPVISKLNARVRKVAAQNKAVVVGAAKRAPRTAKQKAKAQKLAVAQGRLVAAAKKAQPLIASVAKKAVALKASISKATPVVAKLFVRPQAVPARAGVVRVPQGPSPAARQAAVSKASAARAKIGAEMFDPNTGEWVDDQTGMPSGQEAGAPAFVDEGTYPAEASSYGPPVCVLPEDVPIPARSPATKEELMQQWETAPPDAIVYDGVSMGFPTNTIGSWNLFYGKDDPPPSGTEYPDGFTFGPLGNSPPAWGVRGKEGIVRSELGPGQVPNMEVYKHPPGNLKRLFARFWEPPADLRTTQAVARNSIYMGWGPLVGNGKLHGLQYAMSQDIWFWQADRVPSWYPAIVQADAEVKRLNKEAREVAQSVCNADMEAYRLEVSTRDRDRAQREYDMEMAMQEELTASAVEQSRMATQQQQMEQQQVAAQSQFEQQAAQAELQYAQQMAQFEGQQEQAELEYAQKQGALEQQLMQKVIESPELMEELYAEEDEAPLPEEETYAAQYDEDAEMMYAQAAVPLPDYEDEEYAAEAVEPTLEEEGGFFDEGEEFSADLEEGDF